MDYEKDEVPMLSETCEQYVVDHEDSHVLRNTSWTRSASLSLPTDSTPSYEGTNLVGYTGPLKSRPRASLSQMSGPLYIRRAPPDPYPSLGTIGNNVKESLKENLPAYNGMDENVGPRDNYEERNDHLLKSGQLGMCNDPYCTTCPSAYRYKGAQLKYKRKVDGFDWKHDLSFYGDSKGWVTRCYSTFYSCLPGIMNPHARVIQQWNKFFVISCLFSIFIDPLFFFVLSVIKDYKCIVMDKNMAFIVVALRSLTDVIYCIHIVLQFRVAYINPETRVVGAGDLVDEPKKIAMHYLKSYFFIDLFSVLPLPQIIVLFVLPRHLGSSGANYAKNLLRAAVLVQYIPRLYRFLPLWAGQSSSGFIFESAWANFVINLLTFVLAGHVVGSGWYLFGLQRVNQCLREACNHTASCRFIDCGYGDVSFSPLSDWSSWKSNVNATACFHTTDNGNGNSFNYGIYQLAVLLTAERSVITRYVYSLFWGFQQISTLAGNQTPSYFVWEVLFTMAIIGLGLLLFALLIGNMQNFLQSLGRRKLEMSLRRRDVEQWMRHRRLCDDLRRKVRAAERYSWSATRGVNEETLMENLPEDLQREIRKHLFSFLEKVRIFAMMEEPILDAIRERLRQKTYIDGSCIMYPDGLIEKMVFIVRGKMQSTGNDGVTSLLDEGNFCGEELLIWCLDQSAKRDAKKNRIHGGRPYSTKEVICLTNVEAFVLKAEDLEEVTRCFFRYLSKPRVQRAIRYETPYWRNVAATCIQVAWRYRKKRLNRVKAGNSFAGTVQLYTRIK